MKRGLILLVLLARAAVAITQTVNVGLAYAPTTGHGATERWASTPTLHIAASQQKASPATTQPTTAADDKISFVTVNVFIDSRNSPLAAYQFEFSAVEGHVEIVGVESGGHPAFASKPPYYDPAALHREHRVIVAAFSMADSLPSGKTCVARLHLAVYGDVKPRYQAAIQAAASAADTSIIKETTISVSEGAP
ncbi:MAG TPA: hypothetical protein VFC46_04285 [Humisphaera sp.]|nr:hypothetical protein [Humisphaera sp.]